MGILYNRYNDETNGSTYWTLLTTFTDVNTDMPIGDLTGKTELLVVCNDIVAALFCIRNVSTNPFVEHGDVEKIYNDNTGTGYAFEIAYRPYYSPLHSPTIHVDGHSYTSVSGGGSTLASVNTKVFVR